MLVTTKTIKVKEGYVHFWIANNKGVRYNTTIILSSSEERTKKSKYQKNIIKTIKKNHIWNRNVVWLRKDEQKILGLF